MRNYSKPILIAIGVVVALVAIFYTGVNLYLQSSEVQTRIRAATEDAIGAPLQARGISLTPWGGLSLAGIRVDDPTDPSERIFEANRLRLRISMLPLLAGRVEVTSVTLESPIVNWREGMTWAPPAARREVEPGPPSAEPSAPSRPGYRVEIQRFRITDGEVVYRDAGGEALAVARDVRCDMRISGADTFAGVWKASELRLAGLLLRDAESTFQNAGGNLEVETFHAELGGGRLEALGAMNHGDGAFSTEGTIKDAGLAEILRDAGLPTGQTEGTLGGQFAMRGNATLPASIEGGGKLELTGARLEPMEAIRQFGNVLSIDELQLLQLQTAHLLFTIRHERLHVDDLTLETENILILSQGSAAFSGELDLPSRILVNERIQRSLGGLFGQNFKPSDREGYRQLEFHVGGTVQRPRTNLLDRIAGGMLQNLFGGQRGSRQPAEQERDQEQEQ